MVSALSETADWGLLMAGIPDAHKYSKGKGIRVAVLDTGCPNHLDVTENLDGAFNASLSPTATDKAGHGTHVAGIIAALENGIGVIGIAPEAKIIPIKVLGDNGLSGFDTIERGIRIAMAQSVDIINLSLGSPIEPPASFHEAVKEAAAKGIFIFAAAGNDAGNVNWPARYPETIAVGAIDHKGNLATFSSRGPEMHVAGPGVNIYSTYLDNQYAVLSGTSQATPFIAGVAALILSWQRANPSMPPIKTVQDMLHRLDDLSNQHGIIGGMGGIGFGVPVFANDMPWR